MQMMHEYPAAWNSYNSAVPLLSKVKLVPALPNQSGQFFMKKELETPAWDVTYQIAIEQGDQLKNLQNNEMVDLFASFYLLSGPSVRAGIHNSKKAFGFREYWSGVGVFVFKEGENYKIMAKENHGNDQVNLDYLGKNFKENENGCVISGLEME